MPELAEWNQSLLTEPWSLRDRHVAPWGASDVFTHLRFRTTTQGQATATPPHVTVVVHLPMPPEPIQEAIRQASELVRLREGWNSYSAKPVSGEAVQAAITFLVEAALATPTVAAPAVVPTVRGGLQLEWHRRGVDLEIEFGPDASCSWCAEDRTTEETFEEALLNDVVALRRWLDRASG